MNKYSVTMVFLDGVFCHEEQVVHTHRSPLDIHYIVADAFDVAMGNSTATIVSPDVWQVTGVGAVFIVEKF